MKQLKQGVYLKEGKKGNFRLIYPIKKDPDKPYSINNINWFNFITGGSWDKLFTLIFIIVMILFLSWTYYHDIESYRDVYSDPCKYCQDCAGIMYDIPLSIPDVQIDNTGGQDGNN